LRKEFDILRIVNLLRVQEFLAQNYFKAHQVMVIKFFDQYTLKDFEDEHKNLEIPIEKKCKVV